MLLSVSFRKQPIDKAIELLQALKLDGMSDVTMTVSRPKPLKIHDHGASKRLAIHRRIN